MLHIWLFTDGNVLKIYDSCCWILIDLFRNETWTMNHCHSNANRAWSHKWVPELSPDLFGELLYLFSKWIAQSPARFNVHLQYFINTKEIFIICVTLSKNNALVLHNAQRFYWDVKNLVLHIFIEFVINFTNDISLDTVGLRT